MNNFDWVCSGYRLFSTVDIQAKVNADKLFVSLLKKIEDNRLDINKSFTIKEITELIPRGTADVENYATYGFSLMSMLSNQKKRDYFIFENEGVGDEFTSICNNNHNRDNYYWKKHYLNEVVRINPKYVLNKEYPKNFFNLMQFFEGYVRNYRRLNLSVNHNRSMFTKREIDYFASLGEMLGFEVFIEDRKMDKVKGRSRPMDLAWWKWDKRISEEEYVSLDLHLERESVWGKDVETVEKLFSETEEGCVPTHVIGIQYIESERRIDYLNNLVVEKNRQQQSSVLMVYRYWDVETEMEKVSVFWFHPDGKQDERHAFCKVDESGYWFMCF
ncbi:hypothetical protein [Rossellomorea vietnamensis]|uniref:hypothetical protein n=1 Tax=Rossellomorea vietnamensis TaxID=218284 RepID=UPI000A87C5CC|nr:hypothetical protein [Rossellomorea vietnamensis]